MSESVVKIPWPGWELVEQIGRGQFGTVYKISCTKFGITEYAAMKVIAIPSDPQMIENDYSCGYDKDSVASKYKSYLDDVLKEYQLMMKVKGNAGIVRCDDISVLAQKDGIGWVVFIRMEYLTPIMRVLPDICNEKSIIKLGMFMCEALDECERNNILHRDIKPSNILLSSRGEFKLGDFGVSRTLESENTYGTKGIGTYDYMAPEVYNGGKYGKETDIYSLGMVMYWLLNDRTYPFLTKGKAPTALEISSARQKRFNGERLPRPIRGSDALVSVVLKACEFEPQNRYKTAKEMLDDLIEIKYGSNINEVHSSQQQGTVEPKIEKSSNDSSPKWNDSQETVGKEQFASKMNVGNDKTLGGNSSIQHKNRSGKPSDAWLDEYAALDTGDSYKIDNQSTVALKRALQKNPGEFKGTSTQSRNVTNSWQDSQETVGKDYSASRNNKNYDATVGKRYSTESNMNNSQHGDGSYRSYPKSVTTDTKEDSNTDSDSSNKWKRKIVFVCFLLVCIIGVIIALSIKNYSAGNVDNTKDNSNDNAPITTTTVNIPENISDGDFVYALSEIGIDFSDIRAYLDGSFEFSDNDSYTYEFVTYLEALSANNQSIKYLYVQCKDEDTAKSLYLHYYDSYVFDSVTTSSVSILETGANFDYVFIDGHCLVIAPDSYPPYYSAICRIDDTVIVVSTDGESTSQEEINAFLDAIGLPHC